MTQSNLPPKFAEFDPDIVIVDLQVRNMGGMAVVRQIKASLEGQDLPRLVILLDRDVDGFLAKRAGADAWVVKPFSAHELRVALGPPHRSEEIIRQLGGGSQPGPTVGSLGAAGRDSMLFYEAPDHLSEAFSRRQFGVVVVEVLHLDQLFRPGRGVVHTPAQLGWHDRSARAEDDEDRHLQPRDRLLDWIVIPQQHRGDDGVMVTGHVGQGGEWGAEDDQGVGLGLSGQPGGRSGTERLTQEHHREIRLESNPSNRIRVTHQTLLAR